MALDIDLADAALYAEGDPETIWQELRRSHPVYWNARQDGTGFWVVTRYRDAVTVLKDTNVFRSESGMRLDHNPAATKAAAGKMLIVTDPPRHAKIRRLLGSTFTPRVVARLEETMRTVVVETLAAPLAGEACEFTDIAAVLPVSVICDLLGVPKSDWAFMLTCTKVAFGESGAGRIERVEAHASILEYYADLVDYRRRRPGEDVISAMVQGTVDGMPITDEEIFLNCDGLISGGNETTRHATVGGLRALIENPEQWRIAAASIDQIDTVVNEVLRYTSPAMHVLRTPVQDTELAGQRIRAGHAVTVWKPAANRDENVFPAPDRFEVLRTPNQHITFGAGAHFCLGGAMARTELRVLFTHLLTSAESAEFTGPVKRLRSNLIWGYESLPVRLQRR
jgi:cytochrome P450